MAMLIAERTKHETISVVDKEVGFNDEGVYDWG